MQGLAEHARRVELVLSGSNSEQLLQEASSTPRPVADLNMFRSTYADCMRVSDENSKRMSSLSGVFCALSGENNGHLPELCQMIVAALMDGEKLEASAVPHTLRLVQSAQPALQLLVVYLYFGAVRAISVRIRELGPQTKTAFDQLKDVIQYVGKLQTHLFLHPHGIGLLQWLAQCVAFVWSDSIALK